MASQRAQPSAGSVAQAKAASMVTLALPLASRKAVKWASSLPAARAGSRAIGGGGDSRRGPDRGGSCGTARPGPREVAERTLVDLGVDRGRVRPAMTEDL